MTSKTLALINTAQHDNMTSKTQRTIAMIDGLAGVPHTQVHSPHLVVPAESWCFYSIHQPPELREWWHWSRPKYDAGLLFRVH